jgi:phosphatidylserine/phosphatidylglycerophosphate/cardiolipin synthase-like enzyme
VAERKVFVGTFIWKGDEVGRRFAEALTKKAHEAENDFVDFWNAHRTPTLPKTGSRPGA